MNMNQPPYSKYELIRVQHALEELPELFSLGVKLMTTDEKIMGQLSWPIRTVALKITYTLGNVRRYEKGYDHIRHIISD
jgi:hypothetical protein